MTMNCQGTDGFKKAFRKEESIRCSIPSSKTRLELRDGLGLKVVQVLCSHNGRHKIFSLGLRDLELGLGKQDRLGAQ